MFLSFQIKENHFKSMCPMLKHSVTHNSAFSQDFIKRNKNILTYRFTPHWLFDILSLLY